MEGAFKYGEKCLVKEDVAKSRKLVPKKNPQHYIPAGSPVTIVSVSATMAIVLYRNESFSTPLDNLEKK